MSGKKVIKICSNFKDIKSRLLSVPRIAEQYELIEIDPPLPAGLVDDTDYLIADFPNTVPILFAEPGRLKFIQGTWAGIDGFTSKLDLSVRKPKLAVARLSHPTFGQMMAEYALASVISIERGFKSASRCQDSKVWDKTSPSMTSYRPMNELTVGILGLGEIGRKTATLFKGLGSKVVGLVNSPRSGDQTVDRYYVGGELPEMLSSCHYIINILPSTKHTDNILSNDTFSACKNAGFVNIGRGNVCSEQDIIRALDAGWLSEAFLDVFAVEPLPPKSPLWTHPKVTVTPHVAGNSRSPEIVDCFLDNLAKVENGNQPNSMVDWNRLY